MVNRRNLLKTKSNTYTNDDNYILLLYSMFVSLINLLDNPRLINKYINQDACQFAKEVLDWCEDPNAVILDIFDDLAFPNEPRRTVRSFIKKKASHLLNSNL